MFYRCSAGMHIKVTLPLLHWLFLLLLWHEAQGRCSSCVSNECSQTGMSLGWALLTCACVLVWDLYPYGWHWLLYGDPFSRNSFIKFAGNVTDPNTTFVVIGPPTMWQHISRNQQRPPLVIYVAGGWEPGGADDVTLFTTQGKYDIDILLQYQQ